MRRVYILNVEEIKDSARQELLLAGLNLERRQKVARCRRKEDRLRSLGAGLLLQYGVSRWLQEDGQTVNGQDSDCLWLEVPGKMFLKEASGSSTPTWYGLELPLRQGIHGKPYLEGMPVHFNLSHSGQTVICGISDYEIGVDVQEYRDRDYHSLWNRFFDDREKELLKLCTSHSKQQELFFRLWCDKEAYGKLTGRGLQRLKASPYLDGEALGICCLEKKIREGCFAAVCFRK